MTDIELCYKCSDDGATINNMQTIIIPALLKGIEEAKMVIRSLPNDKEVVRDFRKIIVQNIAAITAFYKRFPDRKRVKLSDIALQPFNIPQRKERRHFLLIGEEQNKLLKIIRLCKEVADYADILRGLHNVNDNEQVEKVVKRIQDYHRQLKTI